jgi:hypothetical protein
MRFASAILGILLVISTAGAEPTTAPSADDAPAPAAMASTYISIGKELRLRVALIRRTLGDLTLDAATRQKAQQILDSADSQLQAILAEVEAGHMPGYRRLMAIPDDLRTAHAKLLAAIGPEQSELLQEKLRSLRGEARMQLDWLQQQLLELKLSNDVERPCDAVLTKADAAVDKLPDCEVEGNQYASERAEMNKLLAMVHDGLAKVLSTAEQSRLGPHFAELAAKGPSTQPASGS